VELPGPGDGERFVHNMLIDNALHNQSNLTNSTKDVGNDKGSSRAFSYEKGSAGASPYRALRRIWLRTVCHAEAYNFTWTA
jgi:hypothetical protein